MVTWILIYERVYWLKIAESAPKMVQIFKIFWGACLQTPLAGWGLTGRPLTESSLKACSEWHKSHYRTSLRTCLCNFLQIVVSLKRILSRLKNSVIRSRVNSQYLSESIITCLWLNIHQVYTIVVVSDSSTKRGGVAYIKFWLIGELLIWRRHLFEGRSYFEDLRYLHSITLHFFSVSLVK